MQKIILIILFIINSQLSKSQNIEEYYKSINQAELAIVDSNYLQAVIDYELAFKYNQQPLGKDIYNFAICNLFESNFEKSIVLFQQLVDLEYNIANFSELKKSELGKILPLDFFRKIENLKPTGRIKLNYSLRDSLKQIWERDQHFRKIEDGYKIHADTIKKIDIENDSLLKNIIKLHGYPNEYLIGVNQNLYPSLSFDIAIWRQTPHNQISRWVDVLKEAIWEGNIEPHIGVGLIQNHVGGDSYNVWPIKEILCKNCTVDIQKKIDGKVFYFQNTAKKEKTDEFREGVYLEKIDDFVIKYTYDVKKNKYFKFFCTFTGLGNYQFEKEEDVLAILKDLSVLD